MRFRPRGARDFGRYAEKAEIPRHQGRVAAAGRERRRLPDIAGHAYYFASAEHVIKLANCGKSGACPLRRSRTEKGSPGRPEEAGATRRLRAVIIPSRNVISPMRAAPRRDVAVMIAYRRRQPRPGANRGMPDG
jgi:hypothetical protein